MSSTALSLGTVWQSWLSEDIALPGTLLGGAGYGAAGSIQRTEERDYHCGTTPQALVAFRLIYANRVMFDVTGRECYVSSFLSPERQGQEKHHLRGICAHASRFDRHGVALRYTLSHRDAHYPSVEYRNQTVGAVSLRYAPLGISGFGAVEWR